MEVGDLVRTIKGAQFWGRLAVKYHPLLDEGIPSHGVVVAIAPGFNATHHVYPLTQLELVPETEIVEQSNS